MKEKKFNRAGTHLPVKNLRETLDYYRDKLGFYEEWTFGEKDGGLRRDNLRLLFSENERHVSLINTDSDRLPILWFVDNLDDIFEEFKERKIKIADSLKEHSYGLKEFAFVDINGYYIRVTEGTTDE